MSPALAALTAACTVAYSSGTCKTVVCPLFTHVTVSPPLICSPLGQTSLSSSVTAGPVGDGLEPPKPAQPASRAVQSVTRANSPTHDNCGENLFLYRIFLCGRNLSIITNSFLHLH